MTKENINPLNFLWVVPLVAFFYLAIYFWMVSSLKDWAERLKASKRHQEPGKFILMIAELLSALGWGICYLFTAIVGIEICLVLIACLVWYIKFIWVNAPVENFNFL